MLALIEHPEHLGHLSSWTLIPLLVFVASLFGSMHCLGMCGAIVSVIKPTPAGVASYHLGRLLGYLSLGALAGLAGGQLLAQQRPLIAGFAALWLAGMFIWLGVKVWREQSFHLNLPAPVQKLAQTLMGSALQKRGALSGLTIGLSSVLLPCGWLYMFILGAVATQNIWLGALFLTAFWLGTLPILSLAPALLAGLLQRLTPTSRKFSSSLLIGAGFVTIYAKFGASLQAAVVEMCH
ncbi:MAG: sulfite exporter TauE/SafE family protein [Candidatus Sericytochromatia bacterium]